MAGLASACLAACGSGNGGSGNASPVTTTYQLTVNSTTPSSGVSITVLPADNHSVSDGTTSFTRTYNAGTAVVLTAPAAFSGYSFVSWSGCTTSSATMCNVTMNADITVAATYSQAATITSISLSPSAATIGTRQQITATVTGTGNFSTGVIWTLGCPSCGSLNPGTLSSTGLYTTPYPAPASVTITATSTADASKSGTVTLALNPPASTTGPNLQVDVASQTHAINPLIYGINGFDLDQASATAIHPTLIRWGGDDTSRYNYQNTWTNDGSDAYFENTSGAQARFPSASGGATFNQFVAATTSMGATALGTVPVIGWVSNGSYACSYPQNTYPNQEAYNSYNQGAESCGVGYYANGVSGCTSSSGCNIAGASATVTSVQETPPDITSVSTPAPGAPSLPSWAAATWAGGWVNSIKGTFGSANSSGSVAMWDLDNEPTWWSTVHRDVHPGPFTYSEVTNNGIGTALAIKTVDPTALVSGPVIDNWWTFFYSEADVTNGYAKAPCYKPWSDPADRAAHGGVPLIEYYLQQFNLYSQNYGIRLLDYLDIHGYFAPKYNGNSVGLTSAGDTAEQTARLNGTRVFWDPSYTDSNFPQPNYTSDSGYTSSCSPPAQAPQLIPMMQNWVAKDYPGTKVAIDEYNFGGLESINGAVAQADILGIFGRQGLDLAAFWPTKAYSTQGPGNMAFAMYRNYGGNNSTFGDIALTSASIASTGADGEGQLAVYAALRSSDNTVTVMVINKTYGDLTATLSIANLASTTTSAQTFRYSNANLNAIVPQPALTVTPPAGGAAPSTITSTFPAQSITLIVAPN
jgi:hypothetical protein